MVRVLKLTIKAIDHDTFFPVLSSDQGGDQSKVKAAYAQVYNDMDTKNAQDRGQQKNDGNTSSWLKNTYGIEAPATNALQNLVDAQKEQTESSLSRNNRSVRDNTEQSKTRAGDWIASRIKQITADIEDLQKQLTIAQTSAASTAPPLLPVVNAEGIVVSGDELMADPSAFVDLAWLLSLLTRYRHQEPGHRDHHRP